MPSTLIFVFADLLLAKGAYAFCFNETGSTKMAQSYDCHKVEGMLFEPNVPAEISRGGGRPRNEPQQREDWKKTRRENDEMAESEGQDRKMRVGGEENPK